jgi:hypothetical protein
MNFRSYCALRPEKSVKTRRQTKRKSQVSARKEHSGTSGAYFLGPIQRYSRFKRYTEQVLSCRCRPGCRRLVVPGATRRAWRPSIAVADRWFSRKTRCAHPRSLREAGNSPELFDVRESSARAMRGCVRTAVRTKADVTVEAGIIRWPSLANHQVSNSLTTGHSWQHVAPLGVSRPRAQPDLRIKRLGVRIPPSALYAIDPVGATGFVRVGS